MKSGFSFLNISRDIDPAMLRRLEKRISIPLPDLKTRTELFEKYLNWKTVELCPPINMKMLAARTEGYSGSDIKLVCKEALMSTVRKILPNMVGRCKYLEKVQLFFKQAIIASLLELLRYTKFNLNWTKRSDSKCLDEWIFVGQSRKND